MTHGSTRIASRVSAEPERPDAALGYAPAGGVVSLPRRTPNQPDAAGRAARARANARSSVQRRQHSTHVRRHAVSETLRPPPVRGPPAAAPAALNLRQRWVKGRPAVVAAMADPLLAQSVNRLLSAAFELIVEGPCYRQRQKPTRTAPPMQERQTNQTSRSRPRVSE